VNTNQHEVCQEFILILNISGIGMAEVIFFHLFTHQFFHTDKRNVFF
jgi:hypothetical protein